MTDSTKRETSPTAELAEFASGLHFLSIPEATIAHVKLSILDTLGCAVFGATLPWIRMLREFVLVEGGAPQATLWGSPTRVSRTQAALVNATAAHSFEFDDIHMGGMIHPGALALGAAMSVGEGGGVDGRRLLTAIVAGCEVGARVGMSVGTAHFRAGYHPQGTVGVFVAGAAAGRLMDLDGPRMRDAIGIAGTQAGGLMAAQEGSMAKRLHSGLACQSGVRGAILASEGFTGIADVLEADFGGFCSTMGGGQVNLAALTSGLGTRWETDQIGFKPYASCAAAQSSIEVVRQIREELGAGASARSVTVHSSTHAKMHCGWEYQGGGVTAAQMNIPYGVACMLVHGDVSADRFSETAINDPDVLDMARRVTVVGDEEIDALGPTLRYTVRAEVHTDDGRTLIKEASDRPGGPTQPMAPSAIREKFTGLVTPLLGPGGADAVRHTVENLEALDDVSALASMLLHQPTAAAYRR
jgi:2-methylcitrate dehydratase PrpD